MRTRRSGPSLSPQPHGITVNWTPSLNNGNSTILSYTATATDGTNSFTCTASGASATTCSVVGLTNGTSYTVSLVATNAVGDSSRVHVGSAIPADVPDAPTLVTATGGSSHVTATWTPGANEGSAITGFTATATMISGSKSCAATGALATSCAINGLVDGSNYVVTVTATKTLGWARPT